MKTDILNHTPCICYIILQAIAYAEEAVKLLSRGEQAGATAGLDGKRRRSDPQDGGRPWEGTGSLATYTEDPAELVNVINTLSKKTQQLQD